MPEEHLRRTLMTVHAHPDDEVMGTGGVMARAVTEGYRVVLVTCTRGELGEIVDPELATAPNRRRLAEIRAAELEAAMGHLGVTEWENLGYRDSGMKGDRGNGDPRAFWNAPLDDAARRLAWLVRTYRPDVMTTYNDFGGYGHPDHVRAHEVAVAAFERAGDPAWYGEQLAPEHGGTGPEVAEGGLVPWVPAKLYEQAWPRTLRQVLTARLEAAGIRSYWSRPVDASAEELAAWEKFMARSTVPDQAVTTRVDVAAFATARFAALSAHRSQIAPDSPLVALGPEAWAELVGSESFVLRAARVPVPVPETDLFAGLD